MRPEHPECNGPETCSECHDDGRTECATCGGEEPTSPHQYTLHELMLAREEKVSLDAAAFYAFVDRLNLWTL